MSAPTPGPWDWMTVDAIGGGFHLYIIDSNNRKIAALWGKADEKEANAILISEAPNLLECAANLLDCISNGSYESEEEAKKRLTDAVAKAKGEKP